MLTTLLRVDEAQRAYPRCASARAARAALFAITALGLVLRTFRLGFKPLWFDEAVLYSIAGGEVKQVLEANASVNSAPPLFALLLHGVMRAGTSEQVLRAIPCAAGIAAIPAMYLLAKRFVREEAACFAALLVAIAPNQIRYSQQVREYSLTFLLAILVLLALSHLWERWTWRWTSLCTGLVVTSIFTQYGLAILILAAGGVLALTLVRRGQPRSAILACGAVLLVACLAVGGVYQVALQYQIVSARGASYLSEGYWDGSVRSLVRMAVLGTESILDFAFPPAALLCVVLALGLVRGLANEKGRFALWLLLAPLGTTFVLALACRYPYLGARQTIFLTPMIYLLAALGVEELRQRPGTQAVTVILAALMMAYGLRSAVAYHGSAGSENIRPIVEQVRASAAPDDRIFVYASAVPAFTYYFRNETRPWIGASRKDTAHKLAPMLDEPRRIWLVFSHEPDEKKELLDYVESRRAVQLVEKENAAWLYVVR